MRLCNRCSIDISNLHGNARRCEECAQWHRDHFLEADHPRIGTCRVDDAECVTTGRLKRGLCLKHYSRFMATGTTNAREQVNDLDRYVEDENGCWRWTGPLYPDSGYGHAARTVRGTNAAHIVFYLHHVGPVPDGLDLDHLCRVRDCVNPAHLEPTTRAENLRRGHLARTVCKAGKHDITQPGALKPGTLHCYQCLKDNWRRSRERIKRDAGR